MLSLAHNRQLEETKLENQSNAKGALFIKALRNININKTTPTVLRQLDGTTVEKIRCSRAGFQAAMRMLRQEDILVSWG